MHACINVVDTIIKRDLCSGCGVCAGHCPAEVLSMKTLENGDLAVAMDGQCKRKCGICLSICPFTNGYHDPRPANIKLFGTNGVSESLFDENIGWHLRSVVGYSLSDAERLSSASGGLATWCLESLLSRRMVDKVAVVKLAKDRRRSLFEFFAADSVEEIRESSGSVYHPVEISSLVKQMLAKPDISWAVVGVPCLCASIRNSKQLRKQVRYVLGLACGMYQNTMYTEILLSKSGITIEEIKEIKYRKKSQNGPANNYLFSVTAFDGHTSRDIEYAGLPYFLGSNAYFRLNACNYCKDVFAETADACFMDAWLPEYMADPRGTSLVVIRSKEIDDLLRYGQATKELWIKGVTPEAAIHSQMGHVRRKQQLIMFRIGKGGRSNHENDAPTLVERAHWWLQRRTQARSKKAWLKYGRRFCRLGFWSAMIDILIVQIAIFVVLAKVVSFPKRLARNFRKPSI